MDLFLSVSHRCLDLACQQAYIRYWQHANNIQLIQRRSLQKKLSALGLADISYEAFCHAYPLTHYHHYKKKIEHSILHGENALGLEKIAHFQTEPMSESQTKFIPYTAKYIDELDRALSVWIVGLYQQYPSLRGCSVFWEMSRFPQLEMPQNRTIFKDGLCLNATKRILSDAIRAVPSEVNLIQNEQDRLFAIAVYLVADKHLGMISVWSADTALQIIQMIRERQTEIIEILRSGEWPNASLKFLSAPCHAEQSYKLQRLDLYAATAWQELWPDLKLISCWQAAKHKVAAKQLANLFFRAEFEAKGIWRTEGVVAIPFQNRHPLAYQSHFYEFLNLATQQIVPAWELKHKDLVCPIITTGSGLVRYLLNDVIEVKDFYMQIPCFNFKGRFDEDLLNQDGLNVAMVKMIYERYRPKRSYGNQLVDQNAYQVSQLKYG